MADEKKYTFKTGEEESVVPLIGVLVVLIILVGGALYFILTYQGEGEEPIIPPIIPPADNGVVDGPEPEPEPEPVCDDACHYDLAILNQSVEECKEIENATLLQECYEELADVSLAACLEVEDEELKAFCVRSFAVSNNDIDLCDVLEGEDKEECRKDVDKCIGTEDENLCRALREEDPSQCNSDSDCLLNYSLTMDDADACKHIQNSALKNGCISAVKDTDECHDLELQSQRNYCYQIYAVYSDNYKVCSSITRNSMYHVECLSMFAVSESNHSMCTNDGLTLDNLWSCYTKYALASGDLGGCEAIDKLASTNRFRCAFEYAKKYGNPAACKVVQSLATRDTCYQGAIIYSAENLDPQYCKDVTNFEWRNKCYNEAAKLHDDVSICDEIKEDFARNACISAYNLYKAED